MTRLQTLPVSLQKSIQNRSLLKVISGLSNFNPESVSLIAKAAGHGGADLLDIACEPKLVELAAEVSNIPVCVLSLIHISEPTRQEAISDAVVGM